MAQRVGQGQCEERSLRGKRAVVVKVEVLNGLGIC